MYRAVTSDSVDPSLHTRLGSILGNRGNLESLLTTGQSLVASLFGANKLH